MAAATSPSPPRPRRSRPPTPRRPHPPSPRRRPHELQRHPALGSLALDRRADAALPGGLGALCDPDPPLWLPAARAGVPARAGLRLGHDPAIDPCSLRAVRHGPVPRPALVFPDGPLGHLVPG